MHNITTKTLPLASCSCQGTQAHIFMQVLVQAAAVLDLLGRTQEGAS